MKRNRPSLPIILVALLASLLMGSHGYNHFAKGNSFASSGLQVSKQRVISDFVSSVEQGPAIPGQGVRKEKRHGKTLMPEAIVASYTPTISLWFVYFERHYSPYLPGGSCRQVFFNFSLRGPPAIA